MNELLLIVIIIFLGLLFGRISFFGMKFSSSGCLLVGLIFGHFGYEISKIITNIGLLLFVTGVGLNAGPLFVQNFKNNALHYIIISVSTIIFASIVTIGIYKFFELPLPLLIGVMTGALTSTPGLAAAIEATQSNLTSVGYGIAYPFGVIGVILFIQLSIRFLKIDAKDEAQKLIKQLEIDQGETVKKNYPFKIDKNGFIAFFFAMLVGALIGKLAIPLPGGVKLSLGNTGGALVSGLFFGYIGGVGRISLKVKSEVVSTFTDFGLILFYVGTGVAAGAGMLGILQEYGLMLFFTGAFITITSALAAFLIGYLLFKLNIIDTLGSVTGSMTSTPGLGSLIDITDTAAVAAIYASTYPIALLCVVLATQVLNLLG